MNSPPGVAASELGKGIGFCAPRAFRPIILLGVRGASALPTIFHSDPVAAPTPFARRTIGPLRLAAMTLGVVIACVEFMGMGGNATSPMETSLSRSIMLMLSPPEFATYSVPASGVIANDTGDWPTFTG